MKGTLALLAAAEGADVLTTWYGLTTGAVHEVNPVAAWLLALGPVAVLTVKFAPVAYLAGAALTLEGDGRAFVLKVARVVAACLFCVAAFNLGGALR